MSNEKFEFTNRLFFDTSKNKGNCLYEFVSLQWKYEIMLLRKGKVDCRSEIFFLSIFIYRIIKKQCFSGCCYISVWIMSDIDIDQSKIFIKIKISEINSQNKVQCSHNSDV